MTVATLGGVPRIAEVKERRLDARTPAIGALCAGELGPILCAHARTSVQAHEEVIGVVQLSEGLLPNMCWLLHTRDGSALNPGRVTAHVGIEPTSIDHQMGYRLSHFGCV